jgi:regulator of sigma D
MVTGTAQQVDEYCKQLIDDCAPGGGFILTTGAALDEGKAETTRSLLEAAEKYGKYLKILQPILKISHVS